MYDRKELDRIDVELDDLLSCEVSVAGLDKDSKSKVLAESRKDFVDLRDLLNTVISEDRHPQLARNKLTRMVKRIEQYLSDFDIETNRIAV